MTKSTLGISLCCRKCVRRILYRVRRLKRSDREEAIRQYKKRFGHVPNLDTPQKWSEKITCFKLDADKPIFRELADKMMVRKFVEERIGKEFLIPLLTSGNVLTREMYAQLPTQFVIKANHGSAMNRIVFDKAKTDYRSLKKETDDWLSRNFYMGSRETQYRNIMPSLVIEKLMLDENDSVPKDYKIHCFVDHAGSKNFIIQVDSDRFEGHARDYYTVLWEKMALKVKYPNSTGKPIEKPENLDEMLRIAATLSKGFSYVRVDLYGIKGQVYFGEMTFTPGSGFEKFEPESVDVKWGEWLDLSRQLSLHSKEDLVTNSNSHCRSQVTDYPVVNPSFSS